MGHRPVVLANPTAGPKSTPLEEIGEVFGTIAEVRPIGDDLKADVAKAVDSGAPWVGVAGGDGSLRAAAPVLMAARRPLLAIPCGTKNHFALAVGTDTLERACLAAERGVTRLVDVGYVDDQVFLNTASLGTYAAVVRERDRRRHWPKRLADTAGTIRQSVRSTRYDVEIDGRRHRVWEVFGGNGRYGDTLRTISERDDLADGVLDVRVVLAEHRFARLRLVGALLASTLGRTPVVRQHCAPELDIRVCGDTPALIALDGDALRFGPHTCWRIVPRSLPVLVPPSDDAD
jgi:diacylglycerol kinase family enzyme